MESEPESESFGVNLMESESDSFGVEPESDSFGVEL